MKNKSILSLLIFLMSLGFTTSCEDMLTPDMDRYAESFSGRDSVYFYLGIMRNVQDMVEQNQLLGDLRSDLVNTTAYSSDSVTNIINYTGADQDGDNGLLNRSAYYKVINQCNFYLAKVDTMAKKNSYYMRREYAQVVAIRAWTYLQLVQTYGKVPFITEPVDNADTGWETNPKEGWATADNLLDLLTSDKGELTKANVFERTEGYPMYGEFSTGNDAFKVKIDKMRFYTDVILGDLYLLKGQSKQDFVNAAKHYYYFLAEIRNGKEKTTGASVANNAASYSRGQRPNNSYYYTPNISTWISNGLAATSLSDLENITIIPSAANSTFGRVLTRTAQVYGFDASSRNTTSSDINGSNVSTSGSVSVSANYRSRQVEPSKAYERLCKSQSYSNTTLNGGIPAVIDFYTGAGDARFAATAPYIQTKEGKYRYIVKDAPTDNVNADEIAGTVEFKHYKSIYRLRQIWLRYAEAINRAGFPRMAFAVLRNGLNGKGSSHQTIPELADSMQYDDVAKTAKPVYYVDSLSSLYAYAADYIGVDELRRAQADKAEYNLYLNFSDNGWANYGIHELGCGTTSTLDTVFAYVPMVSQRIADESRRVNYTVSPEAKSAIKALKRSLLDEPATDEGTDVEEEDSVSLDDLRKEYHVLDPDPAAEANEEEILAVETLIADECALETAYEGSRMFDLIRFARHMNHFDGGSYGTNWLAWKIARRNTDLAPYDQPNVYDGNLYGKLMNPDNWYIANPTNK